MKPKCCFVDLVERNPKIGSIVMSVACSQQYNLLMQVYQKQKYKDFIQLAKNYESNLLTGNATQTINFYWWLGQAYKNLSEYGKAREQFQQLIDRHPKLHQGYEGLINILEHKQDWEEVIKEARVFQERFPELWLSYWWLGQAYKNLSEYEKANRYFVYLDNEFTNQPYSINGFIDLANDRADWLTVYNCSDIGINKFPQETHFLYQKGLSLIKLKQFDKAESYFITLNKKFPYRVAFLVGLADLYNTLRQYYKSINVLQQALLRFPENNDIAKRLVNNYLAYNDPESALVIFRQYIKNHDNINNQLLLMQIYQVQYGNSYYLEKLVILYQKYPDNILVSLTYAMALINLTFEKNFLTEEAQTPCHGLHILEKLYKKNPYNQWIKSNLVHSYIELGFHEKALLMIKSISSNRTDIESLNFKLWCYHISNNLCEEKKIFQCIQEKTYNPETSPLLTNLLYLSKCNIHIEKDDICLFCVERNEIICLPFLFEYYRKLGVTKFFVIDNDSTDGSLEFLLEQSDSYIFWTNASYNEAGDGMNWINYLIDEYTLEESWYIVADADEFLVYPNCELYSLKKFIQYLNYYDYEAVSSFMIDMCPLNLTAQLKIKPGDNLLKSCPYFYNSYEFHYNIYSSYQKVFGGIFAYLLPNQKDWLHKVLLMKKGIKPIMSNHCTSPARVADVSSALFHFKFIGNFKMKSLNEIKRKEHNQGGIRYQRYAKLYSTTINDNFKFSQLDKIVKYKNSQQLVDLGLIKTSKKWSDFFRCMKYE